MILVTGGTGLVGRHLLLALTANESSVVAIYRSDDKVAGVQAYFAFAKAESRFSKIIWKKADITDIPSLTLAFSGITHVYHCAALISFDPYQFEKLLKVNVEGTANVVNLALANKVEKLCYVSTIAILTDKPNYPINEENHWDPDAENSVYAITKYGAEMEVWRASQEGLKIAIVNPGVILGEGEYQDGSGALFGKAQNEFKYYPKGTTGFVDVKDVVNAMIKIMDSSIEKERFVLVSENISFQKVMSAISVAIHKKLPTKALSSRLLNTLCALDYIRGIFLRKRSLTRTAVTSLQKTSTYSNEKLKSEVGFTPTKVNTAIERISKHFIAVQSSK